MKPEFDLVKNEIEKFLKQNVPDCCGAHKYEAMHQFLLYGNLVMLIHMYEAIDDFKQMPFKEFASANLGKMNQFFQRGIVVQFAKEDPKVNDQVNQKIAELMRKFRPKRTQKKENWED